MTTENGYAKMVPVGIEVRADTLESVAGLNEGCFEDEVRHCNLGFIFEHDASDLRWYAALIARRIAELDN